MSRNTKNAVWATLALALGAQLARADAPPWDQKQVTALATQLVQVVDEALAASKEAPQQPTALQQRRRDAAVSGYRRVREAAADYLARLEAGRDRDMTEAHFRNLRREFKNTRVSAGDAEPTPTAQEQLKRIDQLLNELGRYYPDA